jgi:hydrogenase-4 component E
MRVKTYVTLMRYQGLLLTLLLLLPLLHGAPLVSFILPLALFVIKVILIPRYMNRIIRDLDINRVIEPTIQQITFLLLVIGSMTIIFIASDYLSRLTQIQTIPFATGFTAVIVGSFIVIFRRKLIVHVAGFLVLENGLFLVSVSVGTDMPIMIELGTLLDVFVVIFLMGIAMNRIRSTLSGFDVTALGRLKD